MLHVKFFNMPVKFSLEFAAIIGSNHLGREQEFSDNMVHKIDLEKLSLWVDFEIFRRNLEAATVRRDPLKGARPGFDVVLKFRMLVLQSLHGLGLDQTEYMLQDRPGWMRGLDAVLWP